MKKKFIATIIALTMAASAITGCGQSASGSDEATSSAATETTESAATDSNFNETGYPIVKEPITLKVMIGIRDVDSLIDPNEMPAVQALEEKTGIHIEWEVVKGADWETKINLMFASGEYPDVILATTTTLDDEEYGVSQQLVIPLDDLVKQYMPSYYGRITGEDVNPVSGLVASDGKTYSVGYMVGQNIDTNQPFFINKTWLDALGLAMPQSLDELTDALRAFKTGDPNGNGEADEIPLEMGLDTGFNSIRYMLPMFGVPCDPAKWIYIDDNKQVQMTATQDGFRNCMEWLHTLYTEQLLDAEVISQDSTTIDTKLKAGNVGFFNCWRLTSMGYDDGVAKDAVLYTPVAPEGSQVSMYKLIEMANDGAYVTASNQHVPETMRWLDSLLDVETMFSLYYGSDGWTYNSEGLIESTNPNTEEVKDYLDCNTLFFAPGKYITSIFKMSPQRVEKTEYCEAYDAAGVMQKYSNDYLKLAPLTSDQIEGVSLTETDINNAVVEYAAKFIVDGVTDESWSAFVKLFDDMGANDYVKIYQDAIDTLDVK